MGRSLFEYMYIYIYIYIYWLKPFWLKFKHNFIARVMASRLLLLPGGLSDGMIERIQEQPLWGSLWPGQNRFKPWYICICESGRSGRRWEAEGLKAILERLLQPTPDGPECPPIINIVDLDWENINEHLARCDVFYMCGGSARVFADMFINRPSTMKVLESIIRSGQILYIGSCGGSCIMSSCYGGVTTMQAIPGMISISDNELQIPMHNGEVPPVTMTKQVGLLLHGAHPQAFVVTRGGRMRYQHLCEMLHRQVLTCFRFASATSDTSTPPPPPPPPSVTPPAVLPTQPPPTADQPFTSHGYLVRHIHVGEHLINKYIPVNTRTTLNNRTTWAVLYLHSTQGEQPPVRAFQGSEIVYAPQFKSYGRSPWKNNVPDWLLNWVAEAQADDASCQWSLFGFSRGAAWGAILAADVNVRFHRVLLVAPYVLPCLSNSDRQKLEMRLPMYKHNLYITFGSTDPWKPCTLIQTIQQNCHNMVFEGLGHEESLAKAAQKLWRGLVF